MRKRMILSSLLALSVLACGSDSDNDGEGGEESGVVPCDQLVGMPTAEVIEGSACLVAPPNQIELFGVAFYDCVDGRRLNWNDRGWGYSDGAWQAHAREDGQLIPPQADLDGCK